jgi:hypothetical protein
VKNSIRQHLANCQRQIVRRLDRKKLGDCSRPVFAGRIIYYEVAKRVRGLAHGGIGALHMLVQESGLAEAIDRRLHLLSCARPYHESDHVLNFAYNALCQGTCLQDIELRRNDAVFLDALGARRIPDPTTAGDFCRRFDAEQINLLQDIFDDVRIGIWQRHAGDDQTFFDQAILDVDGTQTPTTGQCKEGMDISYNGVWGYHPLVVSLANTRELLRLVNRPGSRPSHEGAADALDRAMATCFRGGFRKILLRGDTDFSQTQHLDRWHADGRIRFLFGFDAKDNLQEIAEKLPENAWRKLERPPRYQVHTEPRARPENVKDRIVRQREFETLRLQGEDVAEFNYQPHACKQCYRMIVVRKDVLHTKGEQVLFEQMRYRYFFYITNDWVSEAIELVFLANGRCHQENLIEQLKNGVPALTAPVDNLTSNWAYMVMTSLAWNLKAWAALWLPAAPGRWRDKHRAQKNWLLALEFKAFVNALVAIPCQIVHQAGKIIYRVLAYNPHQAVFFRLVDALHG